MKGPQCRWGMEIPEGYGRIPAGSPAGSHGPSGTTKGDGVKEYARKETGWLTNMPELAELLRGVCTATTGEDWHRHVSLVGGKARFSAIYPPALVEAILGALRHRLREQGDISELEAAVAGPIPEEPALPEGEWQEFWDDVHGGYLVPEEGKSPSRGTRMDEETRSV